MKKGVDLKMAKKLIGALSIGDAGGADILGASEDNISGFKLFNSISASEHTKNATAVLIKMVFLTGKCKWTISRYS